MKIGEAQRSTTINTVWITGAGASKAAGAPLMTEFIDQATDHAQTNLFDDCEKEATTRVLQAIHSLDAVFNKAHIETRNVESLFAALDVGSLIGRFGALNVQNGDLDNLRNDLVTMITATVEASMPVRWDESIGQHHEGYGRMKHALANSDGGADFPLTVITFNYDIALDLVLGRGFHTCLSSTWKPCETHLLKLHGSLTWRRCNRCERVFDGMRQYDRSQARNAGGNLLERWRTTTRHQYYNCPQCRETSQGPPVIVPPTWSKLHDQSQIRSVWKAASDALRHAEKVVVTGYSLPRADEFFRYLYALGSEGHTRIRSFRVYDPEATPGSALSHRFRELIGSGIEDRFELIPETFEQATAIELQPS